MENNKNLIYALIDPRNDEIRYIGKSNQGIKRAYHHQKPSNLKVTTHKINWIKLLKSLDLKYNVTILEYCNSKEETLEKEIYWIKYAKDNGAKLTNLTNGGEGSPGWKPSEETKIKMSETRKQFYIDNPDIVKQISEKQRKKHQIINEIEYKHCFDCDQLYTLDMFHRHSGTWDKLKSICKDCSNIRTEKYKKETFTKLSEEKWNKSYIDRKEAMKQGVIENYKNNPETKKKLSKAKSKPVIGTSITNPNDIIQFESALKAKDHGFHNCGIGESIRYNRPYKGYIWNFNK